MSNTKIGIFDVTQKINKQLTWVLAALLVLEALVCVGDYIGLVGVSRGPLVYGISRITQSGVGKVLLPIVCSYFFIHIWFFFRRSLAAANSLLRYLVLAIIALIGCDMVLGLRPDSFSTLEQIQHPSKFTSFASSKCFSSTFKALCKSIGNFFKIYIYICCYSIILMYSQYYRI